MLTGNVLAGDAGGRAGGTAAAVNVTADVGNNSDAGGSDARSGNAGDDEPDDEVSFCASWTLLAGDAEPGGGLFFSFCSSWTFLVLAGI